VATELANNLSGTVTVHQRFGTATVEIDGDRVDIVTARKEAYASPGSLPEISFSDLNDDLARRDFSINAMALPLSGESPNVIDPHGGLHDLANGSIAILHFDSFIDDPTRMLRAVRYEQRLGFQISGTTMAELKKSINEGHVPAVSGDRWRQEFQKIFDEYRGFEMFSRAIEIGILPAIHPALSNDAGLAPLIGETGLSPCDYLAALVRDLSPVDGDAVSQRLNLPILWARMVRDTIALKEITPTISETAANISAICRLLDGLGPESIAASARFSQDAQLATKLRRYLDEWRLVRTALTGDDLMAMGLTSGVKIGEVLQELHYAKLDGLISSETEERAMVNQIISRGS
jgi:tRNA nucleotidyltransferase (CCA-adding enzyme)